MNEADQIWNEVKDIDYKELKAKALEKQRKKDGSTATNIDERISAQ